VHDGHDDLPASEVREVVGSTPERSGCLPAPELDRQLEHALAGAAYAKAEAGQQRF